MAYIKTLTQDETAALLKKERRFDPHFSYERDEDTALIEGTARAASRAALGYLTFGLSGAGFAVADDIMRQNVRAELVKVTVDKLNEKNQLAVVFTEEEVKQLAKKDRRSQEDAAFTGWGTALADMTVIGGVINAFGQEEYNKKETAKEESVIHAAEKLFIQKALQEQTAKTAQPAL